MIRPDASLAERLRDAIDEIESLRTKLDRFDDVDLDDVHAHMREYVGSNATVAEQVAELVDRSRTLAEWQEALDGEDFDDVIAAYRVRVPWDAFAVELWRRGVITASDLNDSEAVVTELVRRAVT